MRVRQPIGALAVILSLSLVAPTNASDQSQLFKNLSPEDRAAIEQIVHDYILEHPDIVMEAAEKVRAREQRAEEEKMQAAARSVRPVEVQDHIRGNPKAQVRIVEYSDFECPFCKTFHPTIKRVMDEYGKDGKVAWVYRHFPLDALHSKARKEAQASECASEIGENDAFWAYTDRLFEIAPSNDRLDLTLLPKVAEDIGINRARFEDCLKGDARGGKFADHIEADVQNAIAAGGTGTPYTVVIAANGKTFPINGAMPYRAVKEIINVALAEK